MCFKILSNTEKNMFQSDVAFCHWLMLSYTHNELTWYTGLFIYFQKSKSLNAVFVISFIRKKCLYFYFMFLQCEVIQQLSIFICFLISSAFWTDRNSWIFQNYFSPLVCFVWTRNLISLRYLMGRTLIVFIPIQNYALKY